MADVNAIAPPIEGGGPTQPGRRESVPGYHGILRVFPGQYYENFNHPLSARNLIINPVSCSQQMAGFFPPDRVIYAP
jgi:hypothetical protein